MIKGLQGLPSGQPAQWIEVASSFLTLGSYCKARPGSSECPSCPSSSSLPLPSLLACHRPRILKGLEFK